MDESDELVERHRRVCDGYARTAHTRATSASTSSACTSSCCCDRSVCAPRRPRDDPAARWDATAAALFAAQCDRVLRVALTSDRVRDAGMVGPAMPVAEDAPSADKIAAFYGRDPAWRPPIDLASA